MLTDEQRADGWIEHDGGTCPVPLDSKPEVMFRDGDIVTGCGARNWIIKLPFDWWQHEDPDHDFDIIAYRLETPDAQ